jgi:DNA-binding NarL/FixJ family response regulator
VAERLLAKEEVASSTLVFRSKAISGPSSLNGRAYSFQGELPSCEARGSTANLRAASERGVSVERDLPQRFEPLVPLIARGWSNREIADATCLAVHTVENYISELIDLAGVPDRPRLVLWALTRVSAKIK